jgi:predicted nucleic acid-binding protein
VANLVDTSVWVSHFSKPDRRVIACLESRDLVIHSAILGEIAAGSLKNRVKILGDLKMIPRIPEIPADEIFEFIEAQKLFGQGLSWVDLQILASALSSRSTLITDDKRLKKTWEVLSK